jgi:protein-tyrosine phosphatase
VYPKLFVGSIHSAFNSDALIQSNITHVLNASRLPNTFPKQYTYLAVEIRDKDEANILSCIPTTNIFIEAGVESGSILVHCYGGKSRSVAFCCAYLMSSLGWQVNL